MKDLSLTLRTARTSAASPSLALIDSQKKSALETVLSGRAALDGALLAASNCAKQAEQSQAKAKEAQAAFAAAEAALARVKPDAEAAIGPAQAARAAKEPEGP